MNERFRQLAEQAKIDYELLPDIAREPVWIAVDDELEKFAQLIVQECANVGERYADGNYEVYNQIMAHFGLEEPEE
jgi:hypothetical protein